MKTVKSLAGIALPILLIAGVVWWAVEGGPAISQIQRKGQPVEQFRGKVNAPEFPEGRQWLNTDQPLTLKELRGKVVILDFWTYCCINCMHVLPDLKKLERKYPNELVIIGVHSAKFTAEQNSDNIRQAILRYEIEHPVINDGDMTVWRSYAVRAWPTLYVIDPEGKTVGYLSGEGVYDTLDTLVAGIVKEFDGAINRTPMKFKLERDKVARTLLSFPGKVLADAKSKRLFISDSSNNRIVVASLDGNVKDVIGTGVIGLADGAFDKAQFNKPQGLALDGETLYVADTENHAVRKINLKDKTVATLAGTGQQARGITRYGATQKGIPLNSPWDLILYEGTLYVAMAGPHQLWTIDPETGAAGPWAGSGREHIIDGPLAEAALAQPSGITTDGKRVYFADSEVSAIRSADLAPGGRVETIVGEGLFEFGDIDGTGSHVRLQHPLGVAWHDGTLYVADTYNNKIKVIDPARKSSETFLGTCKAGMKDGPGTEAQFDEPGGVSIAGNTLYIADTNNHVIRTANLGTKIVSALSLTGLAAPLPPEPERVPTKPDVVMDEVTVKPGEMTFEVSVTLPEGTKLTPGAPSSVTLMAAAGEKKDVSVRTFPAQISTKVSEGRTQIDITATVYYCTSGLEALCYFKEMKVRVPLIVKASATTSTVKIDYALPAE